jgi:hypothetical protein
VSGEDDSVLSLGEGPLPDPTCVSGEPDSGFSLGEGPAPESHMCVR